MPDDARNRDWLEAEERPSAPGLPRPDLNPLMNPLLAENMGRWAQVYFTTPAGQRERAVEKLLQELQAESAGKKTGSAGVIRMPEPAAADPIELEMPPVSIQSGGHSEPEPQETRQETRDESAEHLVKCPGCGHKNAAEQRFCGICGVALTQERTPEKPHPAPALAEPPMRKAEHPESDWGWLRERTLSSYRVEAEKRSWPLWLAILILLGVGAGAFFAWHKGTPVSHQETRSAPSSQPIPAPSLNLPINTAPAVSNSDATSKAEAKTASEEPSRPQSQEKAKRAAIEAAGNSPGDDGRTELDRARQYLSGEGVPKNSWMASQLLWKAIKKQNSEAVLLLSDLYARGDGVPRSCEQARILLVSAAKKGSPAAAQKLRTIESSCR